jgi:hypothetical protein
MSDISSLVSQVNLAGGDTQRLNLVTVGEQSALGADFAKVLEDFRLRSAAVESQTSQFNDPSAIAKNPQLKQLADMYKYAIDTQLLVRTSSQLTSSMRQLMTGQ